MPPTQTEIEPAASARERLRRIVDDTTTRAGRRFALAIQFLILVSTISFTLETLPKLDRTTILVLWVIELFTVIIFTAEYLLRVYVAERRLRFVFSLYGLIDLIAILPFYIAPALDLRSVRVLRLMRVFRVLKLVRYSRAIERFRAAFRQIREELIIFGAVTALVVYLSAVGIYYFEREAQPELFSSVPESLWWAISTLTTVGYGDVYPITTGGRLFTGLVLLVGIGLVAIPSGLLAAALTSTRPGGEKADG